MRSSARSNAVKVCYVYYTPAVTSCGTVRVWRCAVVPSPNMYPEKKDVITSKTLSTTQQQYPSTIQQTNEWSYTSITNWWWGSWTQLFTEQVAWLSQTRRRQDSAWYFLRDLQAVTVNHRRGKPCKPMQGDSGGKVVIMGGGSVGKREK